MGLIKYGKITKRHGLSGEVKVFPFSREFDNLENLKEVYIEISTEKSPKKLQITHKRFQKNFAIIKFKGIDTPEDADKLKNRNLLIDEKYLSELEEDEYYWHKLIGLKVYGKSDEYIGTVSNLMDNTAQELLVIKDKIKDKEYLVPFVREFISDINFDESKIVIEPIEGLLD